MVYSHSFSDNLEMFDIKTYKHKDNNSYHFSEHIFIHSGYIHLYKMCTPLNAVLTFPPGLFACTCDDIWSHHFIGNRWGNSGNSDRYFGGWAPKSLPVVTAVMKLKDACSLEGKL